MEKFVFIFGPQAVGKMTVCQKLAEITRLKLFHNHMTIDLLEPLLGFTPEMWRLANMFRREIFEAFVKSDQYGLIFTKVWNFNDPSEWDSIQNMCRLFRSHGVDVCFVELEANVEVRLKRNRTPHRLEHKPTKRNIEQSEQHLLTSMETMRLNFYEGEIDTENYIRINNTHLSPDETALMIKEKFQL
jgi:hypothetical protein